MTATPRRRFEIHGLLGMGGFGIVYRATLHSAGGLRKDVAVKFLRDPSPAALARLEREGRLLSTLSHPAILEVYDLAKLSGRVALVTEYVAGADLADAVRSDPPLPRPAVVQVIGLVAEALQAAWEPVGTAATPPHLVHRDIKPSNIRIGVYGGVKLLDFGVAWSEGETDTQGETFVGSVPYMAPERLQKQKAAPAGDVYALGCTLFEGLAGRSLHTGATFHESLAHVSALARSPADHDAYVERRLGDLDAPLELVSLVRRMLAHDPGARPTAGEVATTCDSLVPRLTGSTLKVWCRDREWTVQPTEPGPLSGRVLTEEPDEASFDPAVFDALTTSGDHGVEPRPRAPRAPARRGRAWMIAAVAFAATAATGLAGWRFAERVPTSASPAPASPVPAPSVPPNEPELEPPAPPSTPAPTPPQPPRGGRGQLAPAVEPPAPPPPPPPGHFSVNPNGTADVELRSGAQRYRPGDDVPPGVYRVWAKFSPSDEYRDSEATATVRSDELVVVLCKPITWQCAAQ